MRAVDSALHIAKLNAILYHEKWRMQKILPQKLRAGDTICIIAPSKSLSTITKEQRSAAEKEAKRNRFHRYLWQTCRGNG